MANYTLMHLNIPVIDITLLGRYGEIVDVHIVHNKEHIPVGVDAKGDKIDVVSLGKWFDGRKIPASRDQIYHLFEVFGESRTGWLAEKSLGLSLSDQYWIKPVEQDIDWHDINFFENNFSEDVGKLLFGENDSNANEINLMSPDNTSDGWLKKKWKIINGKRCLIKAGSGPFRQEAYNEVIASLIMERLDIHHIPYRLIIEDDEPYSVCENFVTEKTELVTAWYVMQALPFDHQNPKYPHLLACCEKLSIPNIACAIDKMLVLDYLIVNTDRHLNNFGFLRNAQTLEWIGLAPVFDSGSSLWFKEDIHRIRSDKTLKSKPFKGKHNEQIKLVRSFDWLDLSRLDGIEKDVLEVFKDSEFVSEQRRVEITRGLRARITSLQEIIDKRKSGVITILSSDSDLKDDVAYSGE